MMQYQAWNVCIQRISKKRPSQSCDRNLPSMRGKALLARIRGKACKDLVTGRRFSCTRPSSENRKTAAKKRQPSPLGTECPAAGIIERTGIRLALSALYPAPSVTFMARPGAVMLAICLGYVRNFAWQQFPSHTILQRFKTFKIKII